MKIRDLISFITTQIIMICLLTFNPVVSHFGVAEAKGTVYSSSTNESLLRMHDLQSNLHGAGSQGIFLKKDDGGDSLAEVIANAGQQFLSSIPKKDLGILKTPEGARFLKEHSRLARILALKEKMAKCNLTKNKRKLKQQVLTSMISTPYAGGCDENATRLGSDGLIASSSLKDLMTDMRKTMRKTKPSDQKTLSAFQEDLHMQSLKNGVGSYMSLRYKYEDNYIDNKTGKLSSSHNRETIMDMCRDEDKNWQCSGKQIKEISQYMRDKAIEIKSTTARSSYSKASANLKNSFRELNKEIDKISVDIDKGYVWDSADKENPATVKAMENYQARYIKELQKQDGLLMMTDIMKDKAGGYKSLDSDVVNKGGIINEKYTVTKHKLPEVTPNNLRKAKQQIQARIIDQNRLLNEMDSEKTEQEAKWRKEGKVRDKYFGTDTIDVVKKRKEDLTKLIKTNPAAVGQVLLSSPEYANHVCDAIQSIDSQDISDEKWDKVFMVGGLIVAGVMIVGGAVLMATGLGAPLGAATMAGGITVASAATATVLVVGGIEAAYWGKRTYEHHKELQALETAIFTDNMDETEYGQVNDAYLAFKDARMNFLLALPAVVLPGLGKLASLSKGSAFTKAMKAYPAATRAKILTNMGKFYDLLAEYPKMQKMVSKLISAGKLTSAKMHDFMRLLGTPIKGAKNMKASMNTKFLGWLSGKLDKIDPNDAKAMNKFMLKFKAIVDEGLSAARNACIKG